MQQGTSNPIIWEKIKEKKVKSLEKALVDVFETVNTIGKQY